MTDWMTQAACRGMDPNVFFPGSNDPRARLQAVFTCSQCAVRLACKRYRRDTNSNEGVWGGLPFGIEGAPHKQPVRTERACVDCSVTIVSVGRGAPKKRCETCRVVDRRKRDRQRTAQRKVNA